MRALIRILCLTAFCLFALLTGRAAASMDLWTAADRIPLRAGHSGDAAVLKDLPRAVSVRLLHSKGAWHFVREPGGLKGWVYQGHLGPTPPASAMLDLFAPLPESLVLAEVADTSRSSRSVLPPRSQDTQALWTVLELPLSRQNLEDFLREGGIGEYAKENPQSRGGPLKLPGLKALTAPGGETERLLGLNLAVAVVGRVAKPAFGLQLQRYVNLVGLAVARLAPGNALAYRFVVLDSPVPFTFGLPGGFVMLSTGLLQALDNEAQLALVLARGVAQASLGHVWAKAKKMPFFQSGLGLNDQDVRSPLFAQLLDAVLLTVLRQGQEDQRLELEADAAALQMAYRAGYEPMQLSVALRNVQRAAELSGADATAKGFDLPPPAPERIKRIQALRLQLPLQDGLALGTERFRANR
jgi:hypothetical protein